MMKTTVIPLAVVGIMLSATVARGQAVESWAIKAKIAESCSCDPTCPCMFGSPMTNETCEGSRLYEIEKGHFGGVSLDGLEVIATFSVGKWVRYYVSEGATHG